jgi:hypothetical protein
VNEMSGIVGEVCLTCIAEDGTVRWTETISNLVTTPGDNYYALVTCMKLGTGGATAAAKTGAGAGIVTYLSDSNATISSVSRTNNQIVYNASWGAGTATNSAISEIAICVTNNNATSASGDCIARAVISPARNKQASDTLTAAWTHTFLGSS